MGRDQIERMHLVDLEIDPRGDDLFAMVEELKVGLLVQPSVLIDGKFHGGNPVVRFTGPRNQLEELLNRYDGIPGVFGPAPANPDACSCGDPSCMYTGTDPHHKSTDPVVKRIVDKLYG